MIKSINRIFALTIRNLKEIIREPISVLFIIGLPLVMEIVFYLIFSELTSQFQMQYLTPGIVVFSQSFLTLFIGMLISLDRNTSFLTRLFVTNAKSYEFILSYVLSMIPVVLIQSILFFIIGGIFDLSIIKIEMIYCILLSVITSLLFLGFGVLIGVVCNEKSVGGVASIIISAQSILSGMWFPVEGVNNNFINIMNYLPFKSATILIQNVLNGIKDITIDFIKPLAIVLIYTIVIYIIAINVYNYKIKHK